MVEFYKARLKSGLTVLLERRQLQIAALLVATRAGAAHESARKKGIAHFFEHMPFKGTASRSAHEISTTVERVGGILNAFTADEITAFWCKIPSSHFLRGAEIIADLIMSPRLDAKDIEEERKVILSEISMYHDTPQHYLFDKIKGLLYRKPFGMPVIGLRKTVQALARQDFFGWHRNYSPNNLIVSVVGNVGIDEVKDFARKFEGPSRALARPTISRKVGSFIETRPGLDQTAFALGLHMPCLAEKARYASELFNAILGEGMSSRLFQEVREKRGLAYRIHSYLEHEKSYGHAIIYAGIEKKNIKEVKRISLREIKKILKLGSRELEEVKEQKIGNWKLELEACDDTARALAIQEIATKAEDLYAYPELINDVKLRDVRAFARIKGYSMAILAPK